MMRRILASMMASYGVFNVISIAAADSVGCLFSMTPASSQLTTFEGCPDIADFHRAQEVESIASMLGIGLEELHFHGCDGAPFATSPRPAIVSQPTYAVSYPASQRNIEEAIGPITHELAHVYQLKRSGGLAALLRDQSNLEIELSADFLTGVLLRRLYDESLATEKFQHSLDLIGKYYEDVDAREAHGTPEQRTRAFRNGYFSEADTFGDRIDLALDVFVGDQLRAIVKNR